MLHGITELAKHETSACLNATVSCPHCLKCMTMRHFRNEHECENQPINCSLCGKEILASELEAHEATCLPQKMVPCRLCGEQIRMVDRRVHELTECADRIVNCESCGASVKMRSLANHLRHDCPKRIVQCKICADDFVSDQLSQHVKVCPMRVVRCRFGCEAMARDLRAHERSHFEKDLGQWSVEELLFWIETKLDYRGRGITLARLRACFQDVKVGGKLYIYLWHKKLRRLLLKAKLTRHEVSEIVRVELPKFQCPRGCGQHIYVVRDGGPHRLLPACYEALFKMWPNHCCQGSAQAHAL